MRFLHLADLHIGKTVNGFSMLEDQVHIFAQIDAYIEEYRPQAVVIAGDIYDRAIPGTEAVRVFDDFLTHMAQEGVAVLLIAGNHDSPERLNYASRLLWEKGLYLRGVFNEGLQALKLGDDYGEVSFWLLPFVKPAVVRSVFTDSDIETYDDAIAAVLADADIDYNARNVLVAHQFFTWPGIDPWRSESELNPVGGLDAIDGRMIEGFDYVALGHLHRAQSVGRQHIRYGGSPLKYSFSEWQHEKSVTLVELREKGHVEIKALPLIPRRDLREIKGPLNALLSREVAAQGNREDYLRVILTDEEEIIDPLGKLRSVYPHVMALDFTRSTGGFDLTSPMPDGEKLRQLSSYELFSEFFLEAGGSVMSEEQSKIVAELLETGEER